MKNLKILLPMLAMVLAIGMSSATEKAEKDPQTDYVLINGSFRSIGMELDCTPGSQACQAQLQQGGPVYDVYDAADPTTLKAGDGTINRVWQ